MATWNKHLLRALWFSQTFIAICHIFRFLFVLLVNHGYLNRLGFSILIWPSVNLISLIICAGEIYRFNASKLLPPFFTIAQATRFVAFFYFLWPISSFRRHAVVWNVFITVLCSTFLIGTIYGLVMWKYWRQLGSPPSFSSTRQETDLTEGTHVNQSDHIRTSSSSVVIVVNWIFEPAIKDSHASSATVTSKLINVLFIGVKYIPGLIAIVCLMPFSPRFSGEPLQPVLNENPAFQDWNYVRPEIKSQHGHSPSSPIEPATARAIAPTSPQADALSLHTLADDMSIQPVRRQDTFGHDSLPPERLLGPRYLCYLDPKQPKGYKTSRTDDWSTAHNADGVTDYVFVSYTRRQFYTRITGDPSLPTEQNEALLAAAERDTTVLVDYAICAAQAAKVGAFWIDYECCQPEDTEQWSDSVEDVYRICDIVRSAHSLVIVIGPPLNNMFQHDRQVDHTTRADWLHDWGRRLWTVPEALLTPSEHRISVYTAGVSEPEVVAKRNLASRVWDDAGTLRQLVEHYEASLPLTQLELISIALECLQRRQTEKRMNGDVAYALMGLLRQRPKVVKKDSDFQAFARLSLANDSDMLLERMICLRAKAIDAAWHDLRDAWKARLWDIYPLCQVADIVDEDTIMLGGAQGAWINWTSLCNVDYKSSQIRSMAWAYARQGPICLFVFSNAWWVLYIVLGALERAIRSDDRPDMTQKIISAVFGTFNAVFFLVAAWVPLLFRSFYARDIVDSQARFFGMEGRPNLALVEKYIFGGSASRLNWVSPAKPDQRSGTMPEALPLRGEDIRQFTLIDTLTCSAMLFEAKVPPSIAIVCGREHGFLRTVLCSYDSQRETLCKEAVVRMSTTVLDRMAKLDIFRFTLSRRKECVEGDI